VQHGFAPDVPQRTATDDAPPLADIAAGLVDNIKDTVASEVALLQARAALAGDGVKRAAMWGAIAGGALLIALLALVFGLVLLLVPYLGPILATLAVGALLLLIAGAAVIQARRGAQDIRTAFAERGVDPHWDASE
jgi:uncharacterized membrane protein